MRKKFLMLLTAASAFSLTTGFADDNDGDDKGNVPPTTESLFAADTNGDGDEDKGDDEERG